MLASVSTSRRRIGFKQLAQARTLTAGSRKGERVTVERTFEGRDGEPRAAVRYGDGSQGIERTKFLRQ